MATNSQPEGGTLHFFSLWDQKQPESEKPLPSPPLPACVEVPFSEMSSTANYMVESVKVDADYTLLKGRVSTREVFAVSNSDLVPGKYEGGLKLWEGSLDLVKALRTEILGEQLSLSGKRVLESMDLDKEGLAKLSIMTRIARGPPDRGSKVLKVIQTSELGCGHGLPGIYMSLEGAAAVHFQDFNAEVLRCLTIPNVRANFGKEPHEPLAISETGKNIPAQVRFFSGDWCEVHQLLPHVWDHEHRKSSDSSSEQDTCAGYDIILMAETVYSISSLQNLYELTKKCLSHPNGVIYLAAKKHYFGVGGGTRRYLSIVEKDGVMATSLVAEVADGSSNVRELSRRTKLHVHGREDLRASIDGNDLNWRSVSLKDF